MKVVGPRLESDEVCKVWGGRISGWWLHIRLTSFASFKGADG